MTNLSIYFNTKEPETSTYGMQSFMSQVQPSTTQVLGAFAREAFIGEGTLNQDIEAGNIRKREARGQAITEDQWKESDNYRPGLTYYDTMTEESAGSLARVYDDREERNTIMQRASGMQTAGGFVAALGVGLFEPKNMAAGAVANLFTAGAGSAVPTIGRITKATTVRGAAGRGVVEGVAAGAMIEPSNLESSKVVQGDYTLADTLMNFGLSSILGAGLGAGSKALELRQRGKRLDELKAYREVRADIAKKEFDTALAQTVEGRAVEVGAVKEVDKSEAASKARRDLPEIEERLTNLEQQTEVTRVTDRPEFQKWFKGSQATDAEGNPLVVYHGTNAGDIAQFKQTDEPKWAAVNPELANRYSLIGGGVDAGTRPTVLPVYMHIKNPIDLTGMSAEMRTGRASFYDLLEASGVEVNKDRIKKVFNFRNEDPNRQAVSWQWFQQSQAARDYVKELGYDGIKQVEGTGIRESITYGAFKPEQIKSIFNRGDFDPNDPRLIDINKAEKLEVQRGQAIADSNLPIDQAPIKSTEAKVGNPTDSTAYDPKVSDEIQEFLDENQMEDFRAVENDVEDLQMQVQELYDQGLLNEAEIRTLERLEEIDRDNVIFDNVLVNAEICLTRA